MFPVAYRSGDMALLRLIAPHYTLVCMYVGVIQAAYAFAGLVASKFVIDVIIIAQASHEKRLDVAGFTGAHVGE